MQVVGNTEGHTMDDPAGNTAGRRRLDLKAAAELGVTSEAIRRRAKRGTLPSEKGEDGLLYVWVPTVSDAGPHAGPHAREVSGEATDQLLPEALLKRFEDENDFLRRELERLHRKLERKDAILLTLAQRVPELEPAKEAPTEPRNGHETASENAANGEAHPEEERAPWWRRLFGS